MNKVILKDVMGTDYSIVDAARVSFNKTADMYIEEQNEKLLQFLAKHGHWSPFAHTCISFHVQAPQFVARQLAKHQVGFAWNEVSRRYVQEEPTIFCPPYFRKAAQSVKQGSSKDEVDNPMDVSVIYEEAIQQSLKAYQALLAKGVCPEQARAVLPQATNTEWIWTGSLYAFFRVCELRLSPTAQEETRAIAREIYKNCRILFPVAWAALCENSPDLKGYQINSVV